MATMATTVCLLVKDIAQRGPRTRGTYFWLEVDNWPKWERALVEGPYIHHCAAVHAKVADVLEETCKYIPGLHSERM